MSSPAVPALLMIVLVCMSYCWVATRFVQPAPAPGPRKGRQAERRKRRPGPQAPAPR